MENTYKDPSELHCSPQNHKYAEKDKTCYTLTELKLIANEFNKNITDEKKNNRNHEKNAHRKAAQSLRTDLR